MKSNEDVAWRLLVALAPRDHDTTVPMRQPDWRDFSPDRSEPVTWASIREGASSVGDRLLRLVGADVERWCELLDLWASFETDWRDRAAASVKEVAESLKDPSQRETLRDALRSVIRKSRACPEANWALLDRDLASLEPILSGLSTEDVRERHRWLFKSGHHLLGSNPPLEQQQVELAETQRRAFEELHQRLTPTELIDFITTLDLFYDISKAFAAANISIADRDELVTAALTDRREIIDRWVVQLLMILALNEGPGWLDGFWQTANEEDWGEQAELRLLLAMPSKPPTWRRPASRSPALVRTYWRLMDVYAIPDLPDLDVAIDCLFEAGRASGVLQWLANRRETSIPSSLLTRTLQAVRDQPIEVNRTMHSFYLSQVFKRLDADEAFEPGELAKLEWTFFDELHHSERRPRCLYEELGRSPAFFVSLLKAIFLPEPESGVEEPAADDADDALEVGTRAYNVLGAWRRIPGTQDDGRIDGAALEAWVKEARQLCREGGRTRIADQKIGEMLSAVRRVPGQPWPAEPVRDVIETVRSRHLQQGFVIGAINRRGVTMRAPFDGGALERDEAATYRRDAELLKYDWPRSAKCLETLAENYEADAERHDHMAERLEWP